MSSHVYYQTNEEVWTFLSTKFFIKLVIKEMVGARQICSKKISKLQRLERPSK